MGVHSSKFVAGSPYCLGANEAIIDMVQIDRYYNNFMMRAMASQISSLTIVYPIVYLRRRSNKTSKFRVTGFCEENSPVTG